jgi:glycosyltransferase involved in cell wall biosynthesis
MHVVASEEDFSFQESSVEGAFSCLPWPQRARHFGGRSPLKICQIIAHYPPAYAFGGALQVAHALSTNLTKQHHEVRVCATDVVGMRRGQNGSFREVSKVDGINVYFESTSLIPQWGFSPGLIKQAWKQISWADVVFLHFHYQFASWIGGLLCRLKKKPYVIFTHGSLNQHGIRARGLLKKNLYLKVLEKSNFQASLFNAFHSIEELEFSVRMGSCRVVPNGIDPLGLSSDLKRGSVRQRFGISSDSFVLLYLGRIDRGKGLNLLLPAFQKLLKEQRRVHLLLVGGDEKGYLSSVERQIVELNLQQHVTVTGLLTGADKLAAMRDADVFVLPSRSEGLSIAMLEAMYMGLPVIVSDRVGLCREIAEKDCGYVVSLEGSELTEALLTMATNSERARMGMNGKALVTQKYTWDVIARNLMEEVQAAL